jgi:hypothetical protein
MQPGLTKADREDGSHAKTQSSPRISLRHLRLCVRHFSPIYAGTRGDSYRRSVSSTFASIVSLPRSTFTTTRSPGLCARKA